MRSLPRAHDTKTPVAPGIARTEEILVRCRWCCPPSARRRLGRASRASLARFDMAGSERATPAEQGLRVEAQAARFARRSMDDDPGGVRALLAKLREQQDRVKEPAPPMRGPPRRPWDTARLAQSAPAPHTSVRTMPYAQAVERIYELARDPTFPAHIQKVRGSTDRSCWTSRYR